MGFVDLHTHSTASDGTMSPSELIRYAESKRVSVLALTDHDTVAGIAEAKREAQLLAEEGKTFRFIPGIEISCDMGNLEIHMVGLMIDPGSPEILSITRQAAESRKNRNDEMVRRFTEAGMPMTIEELRHGSSDTTITRAHIARFLTEHGYVKSNKEAFDRYLGSDKPFYVERVRTDTRAAIGAIKAAGGIPVLAHPLLYKLNERELKGLVSELRDMGLMGIEVYYSSNVSNDEAFVHGIAKEYGLLESGGSDFHGSNKPDIEIGVGRGWLKVPEWVPEKLLPGGSSEA